MSQRIVIVMAVAVFAAGTLIGVVIDRTTRQACPVDTRMDSACVAVQSSLWAAKQQPDTALATLTYLSGVLQYCSTVDPQKITTAIIKGDPKYTMQVLDEALNEWRAPPKG